MYGLTETVVHERLKLYGRASAWRADNCGKPVDRAQARTIFAPRRDGMRRAQYRFRTLRHRRTGSASRRTPPARRGIFIFSRKNEIVLDFSLAMWYNSMELKVNTVFTRRSRVAGRARTIGNRVTLNGVREFESLLLRQKETTIFFRKIVVSFCSLLLNCRFQRKEKREKRREKVALLRKALNYIIICGIIQSEVMTNEQSFAR